jgi:hypothetical protein
MKGMSQQPAPKTKRMAAEADGQLLLHLNKANEIGPIPEPNRSKCVELLRMMLQCALDETANTKKGKAVT